ncbi:Hypothetical protein CINCED_3A015129 [Cinara cedri]|uniref:Peptidase S1 domain-containing protein n=1 Tax=Cinara cedri TaxID=506608 RepID=A0A5E4M6B3_9HEMI|nr:Hypothetical protein CINCED_3A015129 [Cinara cedri]
MKSFKSLKCLLILCALCFMSSGYYAQHLGLLEGSICNKNGICKPLVNCASAVQGLKNNIRPTICSTKGSNSSPIVCCQQSNGTKTNPQPSSAVKTYSASEMCHEYSKLIRRTVFDPILIGPPTTTEIKDCVDVKTLIIGGKKAEPKEFPHMALIGTEANPSKIIWVCGGSLISNRWILSAAHCEKAGVLRWVRLGDLNYISNDDDAEPLNYRIIDRKNHPKYNGNNSRYNDITLLKLEKNVEFSPYIRPICLNVESSIKETKAIASGWGRLGFGGSPSEHLLKVTLDIHSINECIKTYITDSSEIDRKKLPQGITGNSQMCVGDMSGRFRWSNSNN